MPKEGKIPPDAKLKATINAFHKAGRYTEKQYAKLSWGHLKQIGQYNHDNNHKPKPSDKSKTPAQWRAQRIRDESLNQKSRSTLRWLCQGGGVAIRKPPRIS